MKSEFLCSGVPGSLCFSITPLDAAGGGRVARCCPSTSHQQGEGIFCLCHFLWFQLARRATWQNYLKYHWLPNTGVHGFGFPLLPCTSMARSAQHIGLGLSAVISHADLNGTEQEHRMLVVFVLPLGWASQGTMKSG